MLKDVSNREIRIQFVSEIKETPWAPYYWEIVSYYNSCGSWLLESYGWSETFDIAFSDAKIELYRLNEKYPLVPYEKPKDNNIYEGDKYDDF